ncbi:MULTISPECIES: GNAT family N-acetyltransferase [Streptomyces]|uniref:GNAT family N-acetyltransferase n=1 Tax=Streptomyces venezuelae TaxID=54571 RepID=A0A5P2API8_STRVZ|nr:GNAT family N-acetyltransferase [Streptomyces venezuelae]QES20204.1 GNAT family N-acetyltransferase [Streptomyces venezuelae]
MTSTTSDAQLPRVHSFLSRFHRRQAARTVDFPGGFAGLDDAYAHSRGNNHLVVDGETEPEALPGHAEEALGHLPFRLVYVLDETVGTACREPMARAGYDCSTRLIMRHTGPVPEAGGAREVDLDALRGPLAVSWRRFAPQLTDEQVHHLVERQAARKRGAEDVRFLASHTAEGEVAAWADLYLEAGIAQLESLVTAEAHLGKGHAGRVLDTALRTAADAGCALRFLTAHPDDWPHTWYARQGFTTIGSVHVFERA